VAELVPDLLWSNDPEGYTTWYNRRWLEYTGLTLEQSRGFGWLDVLHPEDREGSLVRFLQALEAGEPLRHEQRFRGADGHYRWFLIQARPVRDEAGCTLQWFGAATDIQDLRIAMETTRASLAEKEALLKEVHHRVKNNLQVITSLLNLQSQQVKDERMLEQFEETRSRVQSIATIHESLYRSGSLAAIDLAAYAQRLAEDLVRFYGSGDRVRVETSGSGKVMLPIERAVPCGLLLNELLSNALKHAFPARRSGAIYVDVSEEDGRYAVEVADTGVGLPADLDTRSGRSLGLQLVYVLARQIGGTVVMTSDGQGTRVRTTFPCVIRPDEEEE
jgi:PAS domain S-box-containing protein